MSFYLMRHGATKLNKEFRVQGHLDIELSEAGRDQAIKMGKILEESGLSFFKVLSSPLLRARETASLVSGMDIRDVETHQEIIEINFGEYEGVCYKELDPEEYHEVFKYPYERGQKAGVETYESLMARTDLFLSKIRGMDRGNKDILIVTHGGLMRAILSHIMHVKEEEFWSVFKIPNCAVYKLELSDKKESEKDSAALYKDGFKEPWM